MLLTSVSVPGGWCHQCFGWCSCSISSATPWCSGSECKRRLQCALTFIQHLNRSSGFHCLKLVFDVVDLEPRINKDCCVFLFYNQRFKIHIHYVNSNTFHAEEVISGSTMIFLVQIAVFSESSACLLVWYHDISKCSEPYHLVSHLSSVNNLSMRPVLSTVHFPVWYLNNEQRDSLKHSYHVCLVKSIKIYCIINPQCVPFLKLKT